MVATGSLEVGQQVELEYNDTLTGLGQITEEVVVVDVDDNIVVDLGDMLAVVDDGVLREHEPVHRSVTYGRDVSINA